MTTVSLLQGPEKLSVRHELPNERLENSRQRAASTPHPGPSGSAHRLLRIGPLRGGDRAGVRRYHASRRGAAHARNSGFVEALVRRYGRPVSRFLRTRVGDLQE